VKLHGFLLLTAAFALGSDPPKNDAKSDADNRRDVFVTLEKRFLEAWKAGDSATLSSLLADDYLEIGGTLSARLNREAALKGLASLRPTAYELSDPQVVLLNPEAGLLSYALTVQRPSQVKEVTPSRFAVSSAWAHRGGKWLSVFRQVVPLQETPPSRIEAFEATLTPTGVRYLYKGTTKLEDIRARLNILVAEGPIPVETFWGSWLPGESKEISLHFLAFGVGSVQEIQFTATATLNGKPVLCALRSRRDQLVPFNRGLMPFMISPFYPVP
jgi:hypothetical protein